MRQDGVSVSPAWRDSIARNYVSHNGSLPLVVKYDEAVTPASASSSSCGRWARSYPDAGARTQQWLRRARYTQPHRWCLRIVRRYRLLGVWFHKYSCSPLRSSLKRANAAWSSSRPRYVVLADLGVVLDTKTVRLIAYGGAAAGEVTSGE